MMWLLIPFIWGVIWIIGNAVCMPKMKGHDTSESISILVPLRNESARVEMLVASLMRLQYPRVEFLLYDDASTDDTLQKLQQLTARDARFTIVAGEGPPKGWHGKSYACWQLSKRATGQLLLFIDADVTLHKQALQKLSATCQRLHADAVSGFAHFYNESVLEKLLTPLLHFFIYFHLPIVIANRQKMIAATAASGAFIAIKRHVYEAIGGHEAVKDEVVEDVALFRTVKRHGYRAIICHVADDASCAMYGDSKATWRGFQKNCFKAFNESYVFATGVCLFYILYFVLPVIGLFTGSSILAIPYMCITMQRLVSDYYAKQLGIMSFFMPVSACIYVCLLVYTMIAKKRHQTTYWKGRAL